MEVGIIIGIAVLSMIGSTVALALDLKSRIDKDNKKNRKVEKVSIEKPQTENKVVTEQKQKEQKSDQSQMGE